MKHFCCLSKIGAVLSFVFNFLPGAWLLSHADLSHEPIAVILGLALLSNAIFMGLLLWFLSVRLGARH